MVIGRSFGIAVFADRAAVNVIRIGLQMRVEQRAKVRRVGR